MTCTQCHWQVLNHIHPSTSRLIDDNPARVVGSRTWNSRAQQLGQAQSWSAAPRPRKISKCRPYQRPAAAAACQHQGGFWLLAVKISRCVLTGGVVSCRRTHVGNVGRQRSEVRRQGSLWSGNRGRHVKSPRLPPTATRRGHESEVRMISLARRWEGCISRYSDANNIPKYVKLCYIDWTKNQQEDLPTNNRKQMQREPELC